MRSLPILLIRPPQIAQAFSEALRARIADANILFAPLVDIQVLDFKMPSLSGEPVIFTSLNAARAVIPKLTKRPDVLAVGKVLTAYLAENGFENIQTFDTASDLVQHLPGSGHYFRGENVRIDLAQIGGGIRETVTYRQIQTPPSVSLQNEIETGAIVPVFSIFAAEALIDAEILNTKMDIIAMSDAVAACLDAQSVANIHVIPSPTRAAMINTIAELYEKNANRPF
ncbi:MAG: hypothetical protein AAF429_00975 [Pseudomonadota bacterium]